MRSWTSKIIFKLDEWRSANPDARIVLTNGCFDLLHCGHVTALQGIKADHPRFLLVVAVNSDASVRSLKGDARPVITEVNRLHMVASLEAVDHCFLFGTTRLTDVLLTLRPDIWSKAGYSLDTLDKDELLVARRLNVQIELPPTVPSTSTSEIINKIKNQ